ncbi:MAG: tetratricopeptide repeat protein, partial [Paludibacteraceae bacterium]|nr:tetratricopeptide repeat protein [Paludibacteraceae bacterium]
MKRVICHILKVAGLCALTAVMVLLWSCSVQKNTPAVRGYHYTKARYNILFNGREAYKKGMENIHTASVPLDDYNDILPVFELSNQDALKAASGDMDRALEKSEKAIALHSIVKKPKKNPKKARDPKYKAFMAKDEYNSQVQEAWLLRGKALYCKQDMAAAEAIFAYIIKHFPDNIDVCTEAKLWAAMGYTEQGWFYEAEDMLNRLSEKDFTPNTTDLFSLVKADLLLREGRLEEALPFLDTAIDEYKGRNKSRYMFIKAQVLERLDRFNDAFALYKEVADRNTDYVMEFNSVLGMTRCYQGKSMEPILKETDRLIKRASNADYLDRIYYTLGMLYLHNGKHDTAVEYLKKSIESSTRNGIDKAYALVTLGDLYYADEKYLEAQPLYAEAVSIIPNEHKDYKRLHERSVNLDYVAKYSGTVTLQDSLQALAALPEKERIAKVKDVIKRKKAEEEEAQKRLEAEARLAEERERSANMAAAAGLSLGESLNTAWYFYNSTLISRGKLEFQREWGSRVLEDDWRRSTKIASAMLDPTVGSDDDETAQTQDSVKTTRGVQSNEFFTSTGDAELDSYLLTLPLSEEAKRASDAAIEESLYNLYLVYDNRIHNRRLALDTYTELQRRFPNTQYGKLNAGVDDVVELKADSLHRVAYASLKSGDVMGVKSALAQAEQCCGESSLMPKIYFTEAIATGRTDGREKFKSKLMQIVEKYPDSEVAPYARDMI